MTTITKERIELFIKNPLENGLTRGEQMELARIALASLEAEPVAKIIAHYPLGVDVGKQKFVQAIRELPDFGGYLFAAPPAPIVPEEMYWQDAPVEGSSKAAAYATGWNDCREAMFQSGNFRENKDSSTNNFRKIPEASTSSPVTPALLPGGFTIEEAKELHEDLAELPDFGGYLFAAPPAPIVPEEMYWQDAPVEGSSKAAAYATGWNDCREAMFQSGNFRENKDSSTNNFRKIPEASTSSPVTPALLPGGFTIEEAKELHEDLARSHISKALSGEKMKKKDRDADLRWIHGVIVQAAWFVKASLEQNALSGNYPVTPDSWISCSERMPDTKTAVLVARDFGRKGDWRMKWATYIPGHPDANDGWIIPGASWIPSHWMPLPEPPQEVRQ